MLTLLGLAFGTDLTLKLANINGIVVTLYGHKAG